MLCNVKKYHSHLSSKKNISIHSIKIVLDTPRTHIQNTVVHTRAVKPTATAVVTVIS